MNEHYAAVLADLEQTIADAQDGIKAIKRLLSRTGIANHENDDQRPLFKTARRPRSGQSGAERVLQFVCEHPNRTLSPVEIGRELEMGDGAVRGILSRLKSVGKVKKIGRGRYRALSSVAVPATIATSPEHRSVSFQQDQQQTPPW